MAGMILAIDAATVCSGFSIYDNTTLLKAWHKTIASSDTVKRIHAMVAEIRTTLQNPEYNITKVVLEEVRPDNYGRNPQTMKVLFWLQGAIVFMLHDEFPKVSVDYIYPNSWRAACGIHTGPRIKREELKKADIAFAKQFWPEVKNDDEADAIGIGYGYQILANLNAQSAGSGFPPPKKK